MTTRNLKDLIRSAFNERLPWDYRVYWPYYQDRAELIVSVQDDENGPWRDVRYAIELTESK